MPPDLTEDDKVILADLLRETIERDRFLLSPKVVGIAATSAPPRSAMEERRRRVIYSARPARSPSNGRREPPPLKKANPQMERSVSRVAVRSKDGELLGHFGTSRVDLHNGTESVELRSSENPTLRLMFEIVAPGEVPTIKLDALDDPHNYAGFTPL